VTFSVSGPAASKETISKTILSSLERQRNHGCPTSSLLGTTSVKQPSFSMARNDAPYYYSDVNAQSVVLTAPTMGSWQTDHSGFMNSGRTDADKALKAGLGFELGRNLPRTLFEDKDGTRDFTSVTGWSGHDYYFSVTYTSGEWQGCAQDRYDSAYQCLPSTTPGTRLVWHTDTSVFAENWNTNSDWTAGFTNPWVAREARYYRNGTPYQWDTESHLIGSVCTSYPPDTIGAITGELSYDGTAQYHIEKIPLPAYC